jgi:hypothetical protein
MQGVSGSNPLGSIEISDSVLRRCLIFESDFCIESDWLMRLFRDLWWQLTCNGMQGLLSFLQNTGGTGSTNRSARMWPAPPLDPGVPHLQRDSYVDERTLRNSGLTSTPTKNAGSKISNITLGGNSIGCLSS